MFGIKKFFEFFKKHIRLDYNAIAFYGCTTNMSEKMIKKKNFV
jgi:hypothetical protein